MEPREVQPPQDIHEDTYEGTRETAQAMDDVVIPVVEEELEPGTRSVKTGSVRIDKHVEKRIRKVEAPVIHEDVEIRHVPINREVSAIPKLRRTGNTVVIPVVEEELIVTKRLVLKEEIHLIKHRTTDRLVKEVELNRETAEIRRLDAEGRIIDDTPIVETPRRRRLPGSILADRANKAP